MLALIFAAVNLLVDLAYSGSTRASGMAHDARRSPAESEPVAGLMNWRQRSQPTVARKRTAPVTFFAARPR